MYDEINEKLEQYGGRGKKKATKAFLKMTKMVILKSKKSMGMGSKK
jgi:hypothetical protein